MAQRAVHKNTHRFIGLVFLFAVVVSVVAVSVVFNPANALHGSDNETFGIGEAQSTLPEAEQEAMDNMAVQGELPTAVLTQQASRSITVEDPDPVVVLTAVDQYNAQTVAKAETVGTLNPLPTAPRVLPDVSNGWKRGTASAYSYADNDDGKGNFGTTATASGVPLSETGITVAVPASQSHLIGHAVAIMYGDKVVVATVTDTGGFAGYGRALDLAPGVWKAFGAANGSDWGVREVYYKFL